MSRWQPTNASSCIVYWRNNKSSAVLSSPPITSKEQAIKVAQALMIKPVDPAIWVEVRRLGTVIYRTEASDWE